MGWKSSADVRAEVRHFADLERLKLAFSLREYIMAAVFAPDYLAPPQCADAIVPTEAGEVLLQNQSLYANGSKQADNALALFRLFFHHDLLIDLQQSDLKVLRSVIESDALSSRIRWPYRYGRILYDKFNDTVAPNRVHHLFADDVHTLLEDTPQGVYQIGSLVSGPLGLLSGQDQRRLRPALKLPLWHCSDTGCRALHHADLISPPVPLLDSHSRLRDDASRQSGPPSEWQVALSSLIAGEHRSGHRTYFDLPVLIADSVLGDERTALLTAALNSSEGGFLRQIIGSPPRRRNVANGSAEEVAARFADAEQLQLLFLLRDTHLVALLDDCVLSRKIRIPPNEVRRARFRPQSIQREESYAELSSYGIRRHLRDPLKILVSTIWKTYKSKGLLDELGWKLAKRAGAASRSLLMDYVKENGPEATVQELVLSSMTVAFAMAEEANFAFVEDESSESTVKRFLWRCGFNPPRYADDYFRLRQRLDEFNEVLLNTGEIRTEEDREEIRRSGVNFFVSVEHFLEQLVSYNIWLLSSDHFANPRARFQYDGDLALASVSRTLGSRIELNSHEVAWSDTGNNALGTLMVYLGEARKWMRSRLAMDGSEVERSEHDLPFFVNDPLGVFPFRHTQLWADCDLISLNQFIESFEVVVKHLAVANLAGIRNGLDHKRTDASFPEMNDMVSCVTETRSALELADSERFIPKTYWCETLKVDHYGREEYVLRDYRGRPLQLNGPSGVISRRKIRFHEPVIVAWGNLLALPNSELIFGVSDQSLYANYWSGYPRRRKIPAPSSNDGAPQRQEDQLLR